MRVLRVSKSANVWQVAFSRDSSRLAAGSMNADVRIWGVTSTRKPTTLPGTRDASGLAFTPSGCLAVAGHRGVAVWDLEKRIPRTAVDEAGWMTPMALSHDGARLVWMVSASEELVCWDRAEWHLLWSIAGPLSPCGLMAIHTLWEPGDRQLLVVGADRVQFLDAETGEETGEFDLAIPSGYYVCSAALRPDGSTLACGVGAVMRLYDPKTGRVRKELPSPTGYASRLAYTPDGRRLARAVAEGHVQWWEADSGAELPAFDP